MSTIMPCYDKKLEAVRKENEDHINTVLSTRELLELMEENKIDIDQNDNQTCDVYKKLDNIDYTSNGYLDNMINAYIEYKQIKEYSINMKIRKNNDFQEIEIV